MSSIIEGYNYDVFISYRQKDNKYDGWVTEFVENLKKELEATFKEEIGVYFDINPHDGLLETHDVDASLKEKLRCLIFIPVLSRTYCDPKSFAWEHEFKAFVDLASNDQFGLKIKLPNGNIANRVLPIRIYDLDIEDNKLCELVLGGMLRGVEFIYTEPGVNRPLTHYDDEKLNLNKTRYRNQINKIGNAIKEIFTGLKAEEHGGSGNEKIQCVEPSEQFKKEQRKREQAEPLKPGKWKLILAVAFVAMLITVGMIVFPKLFNRSSKTIVEKSVALMPFKNLTGNVANDFLAEMQDEALYQELGKISQVKPLRVVGSRTTSALEKNRMTISELARDASVDYLIEGSVLSTGDLEEIMIQLIQIFPEERLLWANNYTSDRKNILRLHNTIAEKIAQKIDLDLLPQDLLKLPQAHMVNPQSYEAYSRGMAELEKTTEEGRKNGLEYLHEAVRVAPEDPIANAGLALGYLTVAHSPLDPGDALSKGEEFALKALNLDSTMAEVHASLAMAYLYKSWKFMEAEKHFKRALELNSNLDMAHYHYSWALYLWGRMEEAIEEHKLAQKYDPFNPLHTAWLGELYIIEGRYDDAVKEALESLEIQKDYAVGYFVLGSAYVKMGRIDEAINIHKKLAELYPVWNWALGLTYAVTNHIEEAEKILREIEARPISPFNAFSRVVVNAALGNKDEAFKWLAYEPHHGWIAWAAVLPWFKGLHGDPRFNEFVNKLNLPQK
jgi:TolB-like protein/Flp pilus assembly protein TadD